MIVRLVILDGKNVQHHGLYNFDDYADKREWAHRVNAAHMRGWTCHTIRSTGDHDAELAKIGIHDLGEYDGIDKVDDKMEV